MIRTQRLMLSVTSQATTLNSVHRTFEISRKIPLELNIFSTSKLAKFNKASDLDLRVRHHTSTNVTAPPIHNQKLLVR